MWREAELSDDPEIVRMCSALDAEDPGLETPIDGKMERTLHTLRREPWRGRALVLDVEGVPSGYALLISFWSNEMGGEVLSIDELYVDLMARNQNHATQLLEFLVKSDESWLSGIVALTLEVSPNNRARRLYERLGFHGQNLLMSRRRAP